jgi:chaperonin GroEL
MPVKTARCGRERPPACRSEKNNNIGYDVLDRQVCRHGEGGVIDPAKVTRGALENAASIASMILTTEA